MRYYFHLRVGPKLSPDEVGLDLPDLENAYLEAFQAAQEMWGELLSERSDPLIRSFEIADEQGQLLLTLPFAEVLDRARKARPPFPACSAKRRAPSPEVMASQRQKLAASLRQQIDAGRATRASLRQQIDAARETLEATRQTLKRTAELLDRTRQLSPPPHRRERGA
jgi:hypothetical protein